MLSVSPFSRFRNTSAAPTASGQVGCMSSPRLLTCQGHFFDEMPSNALSGRPMSGRGRKGFGEAGTPFDQEKDPLIKRETLELMRAYYKIREDRVRKRIFEMVKAAGAVSHAAALGGGKHRRSAHCD